MRLALDISIPILALIILFCLAFRYRHPGTCEIDPMLEKLRLDLLKIDPRAARLQFFPGDESYTEDKEKIFICLKDEHGNYYPYNMLMEVMLHELSHANTTVIDEEHVTPEFKNENKRLVDKAASMGLFNPKEPRVAGYCPKKK